MRRWLEARTGGVPQSITRSEAFRVLRTNLEVALLDLERPSVIVTSALAGEGKTSTCAQLALAFAEAGRRVVVVDLDLRNPDVHTWFDIDNIQGASQVISERCRLDDALQYVGIPAVNGAGGRGLYLLPAGEPVPNATELLGSGRTARLLDKLSSQADIVLVDTPPVLPVADTLVIARMCAGAVLVVGADTPVESSRAARDALVRNHSRVLGVVLNRFDPRRIGYAQGSLGYGYGTTPDEAEV